MHIQIIEPMFSNTDNPEVQPPSLAEIVREETEDGRLIVRFLIDVMQGFLEHSKPCHRLDAARQLLNLGFHPAQSFIDANTPSSPTRKNLRAPGVLGVEMSTLHRKQVALAGDYYPALRPRPPDGPALPVSSRHLYASSDRPAEDECAEDRSPADLGGDPPEPTELPSWVELIKEGSRTWVDGGTTEGYSWGAIPICLQHRDAPNPGAQRSFIPAPPTKKFCAAFPKAGPPGASCGLTVCVAKSSMSMT